MKLSALTAALVLAGLASQALAQTSPQRVTITGSSIKRIATEGALPMQVITRVEIEREGIVTAEQLISSLSVNGTGLDNLASNADVVGGAQRGNNGATSANLRGQGSNATLILLNGRRVASHGLNGGQVDLNQIPMAAVERIEVLKDGASAIYGTDAIGGVINFILRTNFDGLQGQAFADVTQAGGGNIYRGSLVGGFGDLERDRFNLLAVVAYTDNKALRADQRDFVNSFQPDRGLSVDTRGTPYATIFPLAGTLFPTAASTPFLPGSTTVRASGGINVLDLPGGAGCASVTGMAAYDPLIWNLPTAGLACAWDTGRAVVLQQPIQNLNFVSRGTLRLGEHQLVAEVIGSHAESAKRFSNAQISPNTTTQQLRFPRNADSAAAYDSVFNSLMAAFPTQVTEAQRGQPLAYRWRCIECGEREINTKVDTQRLLIGADGPLFSGWDYRTALYQSSSEAKSTLGGGYYFRGTTGTGASDGGPGIIPALNSGKINVFLAPGQTQSAEGLALLEAASARGTVLYGGKFTVTEFDASASGPVFKLPGGDAMAAVGVDVRTEKYRFNGDERELAQQRIILLAAFDPANVLLGVKRETKAVFGELLLPLSKSVELSLAARHDDYSGFGTTTNPKVSGLWKPSQQFLARASYSTGFRVPTFNQIFNQPADSASGVDRVDPATCPGLVVNPGVTGCEAIRPDTRNGGRLTLGPEKAKMMSAGFVVEPVSNLSLSVDWWSIKRTGTIQTLGVDALMRNYSLFPERFLRDGTGTLVVIDNTLLNAGETEAQGVELSLRSSMDAMGARWTFGLEGSYLVKKRSRVVASADWGASEVGIFSRSGDLGLRWKHSASLTYKRADWSSTLSQLFRSGYTDQVLPGVATGTVSPPNWKPKVADYTTYNWSLSYNGIKNLTVTGRIGNLFDKDPPFAISYDSDFGSGSNWEPRVADPRGRSFGLMLDYKFF